MKKTAKIPTSKATNAYELLDEVKALILEEPKRYNQSIWKLDGAPGDVFSFNAPRGLPACGTVACVAGWVQTLKPKDDWYIEDAARKTLGLTVTQAVMLFNAGAIKQAVAPQTVEYATLGAQHIARFQKRYEKRLKATAV